MVGDVDRIAATKREGQPDDEAGKRKVTLAVSVVASAPRMQPGTAHVTIHLIR